MTHGCRDCRYCRCYPGDRWTPDDYECVGFERELDIDLSNDELDNIFTRVWEDSEEWDSSEEPICPAYGQAPTEEDEYWARYAYEENHCKED